MASSSSYHEYVGNMHMHTPYSDGEGSHDYIANAARRAGIDFVVVTDHNVLVQGIEGYYGDETHGYVLLLTGEEIHDQTRLPQVNHLLVYNASIELSHCADNPQGLIDAVNAAGGTSFLAHPNDHPLTWLNEPSIPWVDWNVQNFTGLEIWNYMASVKALLTGPLTALRRVFQPEDWMIGPLPETMVLWDRLLSEGYRVVGIGNADAHATRYGIGPLYHTVYPYDFVFSCVNTHVLTTQPFLGNWMQDKLGIYRAIRQGNLFIGYDLLGSTRGFRFSATGRHATTIMGGTIELGAGVTLQALASTRCHLKLIHQGKVIDEVTNRENLTFTAHEPGAYRIEVWRTYKGKPRTWILSNPIYITDMSPA